MSTQINKNLDLVWQQRLARLKERSGLSYQVLAARLKMDPSNLYKACQGKIKVPMAVRIRYFDFYGFRSMRSAVLSMLPKEAADSLLMSHDALLTNTMQKNLRRLPLSAEESLKAGNEHPAWMAMLDRLKEEHKTDRKLAEAIGCSRSMLSMLKSTGQRLPMELKFRIIDMTDFILTDALLLSLLPTPVIDAINEHANERPDPEFEPPLDPRLSE